MKNFLFTIILSCAALLSSAQFTVVSSVNAPEEGESWEISNLTQNLGIGYNINDKTMIGTYKNGDNYEVFARHKMNFGFLCLEAPTEEATENMRVGFGSYITIYNGLSINPIYMIPLKEDENGEREGSFKVGLSYSL
jgi:hypothetical protein